VRPVEWTAGHSEVWIYNGENSEQSEAGDHCQELGQVLEQKGKQRSAEAKPEELEGLGREAAPKQCADGAQDAGPKPKLAANSGLLHEISGSGRGSLAGSEKCEKSFGNPFLTHSRLLEG
jgi:hypothetical protein